jgi:NAD(P)-dependent dehydrogenase (short-subunit alcohol dehydrogenase family)
MNTPQSPIASGFNALTTADDVIQDIDLTGKVAIVTGGYSGIGLVTARALALAGAWVIVPARDQAKAREALRPFPSLIQDKLDLADPASVDAFADRFLQTGQSLHILINNAGVMAPPLVRNAHGEESQFAINHLGHFQLTARLWPALRDADGARVVALSSRGHMRGGVDFDDWNFERREYDRWLAYGQSKTANALFALKLDEVGKPHGVRAFSVHPGAVLTGLLRHMSVAELRAAGAIDDDGEPIRPPANNLNTPEQGAATSVWCATSHQLDGMGGVYCENCNIAEPLPADSKEPRGVGPWAMDPALATRLWKLSEDLTGHTFR